ncbi:MAG: DNA polymerase/3'-5' exonuclease PolX [Candidatus Omnitrophica bacterium]|nr:DNA polymerase/3'-5' exonuclease PolX [Candidatus Omnitrophota bacterium]
MNNKHIADIFSKIADMLEVKNENVFRVRAYRTAANNISSLSREISDIYAEDPSRIDDIPGIGKDLKAKILELIETGELAYFKQLQEEFPKGFIQMMSLEGLGPKKLKKLRDEVGIENVDQLEKACREGRLESVQGMGVRTEEKLLAAIEHFRQKQGRLLLPEAYEMAEELTGYLKKSKVFRKVEKAGSLRRGRETVGDLDILAEASDPRKAMEHFCAYPLVSDIIAKGSTKSSVKLVNGTNVDLRLVEKRSFGAAMVYFTGSKQHNVKIRHIAKGKGLKVSEYGVFSVNERTGSERFVAGRTEEELYRKLGMEWIPPELREMRGEVEAALEGKIPKDLVKSGDIKGDLHVHTTASDGNATVEEVVKKARKLGYEYVAVSDHSQNVAVAGGLDRKRLLKNIDKIRKLDSKTKGINILAGSEVDILDKGRLDYPDSVLKELDWVTAAIHSKFSLPRKDQTERVLRALDNKYVNVLAHPSGRLITRRRPLQLDFDAIFRKAAENGVFMEINTHGDRIDLNDTNSARAKELGCRFCINSDAHSLEQMELVGYGVITARRAWLRKKDIINTLRADELVKLNRR